MSVRIRWQYFRQLLHQPVLLEILPFCLPAVLLGLFLRGFILFQMPYAFYHDDTRTVISSSETLAEKGKLQLHTKKTFLAPILYGIPLVLTGPPVLPAIAMGQHALGLLLIVVVGLLARLWFKYWKAWIIPLTVLFAIHPFLLWYEHLALPEYLFIFFVATTLLAGTLFYQYPNWKTFALLVLTLLFTAGSRPEGKLLCFFGLLLVTKVYWKQWKLWRTTFAILFLATIGIFTITKTGQSGLLLYASVVHLTPERLWSHPDFSSFIAPLKNRLKQEWPAYPEELVRTRREITEIATEYLKKRISLQDDQDIKRKVNQLCQTVAFETCFRSWYQIPRLVANKFLTTLDEMPCGTFDSEWIYQNHLQIMFKKNGDPTPSLSYARTLLGKDFLNAEELKEFLQQIYHPFDPDFLTSLQQFFTQISLNWRLPDHRIGKQMLRGLPWFYLFALLGAVGLCFKGTTKINLHLLILLTLLGLWLAIFAAANIKPRFRIVFEPYWILYFFALADLLTMVFLNLLHFLRNKR